MIMRPADLVTALVLQPALVVGVAAGVAVALRRAPAAARHAVWTGGIIAALALPAARWVVPAVSLFSSEPAPRAPIAPSVESMPPNEPLRSVVIREWLVGREVSLANKSTNAAELLLGAWLIVAIALLALKGVAHVRAARVAQRGVSPPKPIADLFDELKRDIAPRSAVRVLVSDEVAAPALVGPIRPAVLLPVASAEWNHDTLRAVLVHELAHVARRDGVINIFADVVRGVYWCNPMTRWACARLQRESERACDDYVLRDGMTAEDYSRLLLTQARAARAGRGLPSAATAMARAAELESRLLALFDPSVGRQSLPRRAGPLIGAAAFAVAVPAGTISLLAAPVRDAVAAQRSSALEPDRRVERIAPPDQPQVRAPKTRVVTHGPDSALIAVLTRALDHTPLHEEDFVRDRAEWALGQVRDGLIVQPLLDSLGSADWRVQANAIWALMLSGEQRVVPHLIPLAEHPVWRVRAMAAAALRAMRDPRATTAMLALLGDEAWQVRVEAVEYFGELGDPAFREYLRPSLTDRHIAVRSAAEQITGSKSPDVPDAPGRRSR